MPATPRRPIPSPPLRRHYLLWLILLVAGVLRLARLDLTAFELDEGAACIMAVRFVHYGLIPLVGIKTSFQFYNSPLFLYVLAPAFLVTTDPRFAALCFALLGTLAVYVVYRTGREFFSPAVGLLAAAMMAVSPAAVDYSRRLWGHSLIASLAPLAFYLMLRWAVAGRARAVFWLALVIAAMQQFHFSGSLLWLQLILLWVIFRPRTDWTGFVLGLALGFLAYVPFFMEEADTGFPSCRIIWNTVIHGAGSSASFTLTPLVFWFTAVTDFDHNNFLQHEYSDFLAQLRGYRLTQFLAGAAWLAALVAAAVQLRLGRRAGTEPAGSPSTPPTATEPANVPPGAANPAPALPAEPGPARAPFDPRLALFLTWPLIPLAVFLCLRIPVVPPYFLVVYPVPFLAVAWAAVQLWQWLAPSPPPFKIQHSKFKIAKGLVVALFAAWIVCQLAFHLALLVRLDRNGGGVGSYASLGSQQAAMRFVANYAPGKTVMLSEDQLDPSRGVDFRYWFLLWTFDHDTQRFFPRDRNRAEYWFVIRNGNYRLRPDFAEFLARCRAVRFGFLEVYVIPRPGPWPQFGVPPSPTSSNPAPSGQSAK